MVGSCRKIVKIFTSSCDRVKSEIYVNICFLNNFFRNVASGRQFCSVPIEDQHASLNLLLELALQKGKLSSILDMVLLLLNLWSNRTHTSDNR